jgi:hypothetical protein
MEKAIDRRQFLQLLGAAGFTLQLSPVGRASAVQAGTQGGSQGAAQPPAGTYKPGRIQNEYSLFLPGEREALAKVPQVRKLGPARLEATLDGSWRELSILEELSAWQLLFVGEMNGVATAVFEKQVTHQGAIAYVTELGGTIALIPKQVGALTNIRPRPTSTPHGIELSRAQVPGPDLTGNYLLQSTEDPCYENVAALGAEYIGWSLVANEEAGPMGSIYLDAAAQSRQPEKNSQEQWAPDLNGLLFDPAQYFPLADHYTYQPGWSKRTLLGGYLPVACTGVWNAEHKAGYEVIMLLPPGTDSQPIARVRLESSSGAAPDHTGKPADDAGPRTHFWHCSPGTFYENLLGIWNHWSNFYEASMAVEIPDQWLLDAARAGITLCRCSYRGLEPTYQIGEGGYTKIPERSHALFPVAHYEFIWAHQLWGLAEASDAYFQHYLDMYILPDGNFLYNTQDQVEGPLNAGLFLWNSARSYWYTGDAEALRKRLPVLERILGYVLARYEYGKVHYPRPDRRYGLIWGSPEADLGDTNNDTPTSHPFYYQNAACVWRGLHEHARVLVKFGSLDGNARITSLGERYTRLAEELRTNIRVSLEATVAAANPAMRSAGITPFEPNDTRRQPTELSSYENHRFMMDWFLADWGDAALDLGHLRHRELAGEQICGLHTDGNEPRTSNFMEHGTLAVRIRQEDYRPFLLTLYALVCYAADSGNRYSPEDAYIPGSYPGEGSRYGWSAVVNSALQPALGLRWLLCYEESDLPLCHLQKGAPKHWFAQGERIRVRGCPTRWGLVSWSTEATGHHAWRVEVQAPAGFAATLAIHIHPSDGRALQTSSAGTVAKDRVSLTPAILSRQSHLVITVT